MTGFGSYRGETAAEYLRSAAGTLRENWYGGDFAEAVADWLENVAHDAGVVEELDKLSASKGMELPYYRLTLRIAATVLGREWVPS